MSGSAKKAAWRPVVEGEGPWLIRSHYHGAWHVRSSTGGAAGYTDNIAHAGIFDFARARAYHDRPPEIRDEAIPGANVFASLEAALAAMDGERAALIANIQRIRGAGKLASQALERSDQPATSESSREAHPQPSKVTLPEEGEGGQTSPDPSPESGAALPDSGSVTGCGGAPTLTKSADHRISGERSGAGSD